jgi:hypothetical protein
MRWYCTGVGSTFGFLRIRHSFPVPLLLFFFLLLCYASPIRKSSRNVFRALMGQPRGKELLEDTGRGAIVCLTLDSLRQGRCTGVRDAARPRQRPVWYKCFTVYTVCPDEVYRDSRCMDWVDPYYHERPTVCRSHLSWLAWLTWKKQNAPWQGRGSFGQTPSAHGYNTPSAVVEPRQPRRVKPVETRPKCSASPTCFRAGLLVVAPRRENPHLSLSEQPCPPSAP